MAINISLTGLIIWLVFYIYVSDGYIDLLNYFFPESIHILIFVSLAMMSSFGFWKSFMAFKNSLITSNLVNSMKKENEIVLKTGALYVLISGTLLFLFNLGMVSLNLEQLLKNSPGNLITPFKSLLPTVFMWLLVKILVYRNKIIS